MNKPITRIELYCKHGISKNLAQMEFDVLYGHIDSETGHIWAAREGKRICFDDWLQEKVFDEKD